MPRILGVGGDPELQHAGARDDPLDHLDFRLIDFRHDHFQLIETEPPNGHFLLPARIHAAAHGSHELVHIDRGLLPPDEKFHLHGVAGRGLPRQPDLGPTEIELLHPLHEGFAGHRIGGVEADGDPPIGSLRGDPLRPILGGKQLLNSAHAVVHLSGDLLGGIDFINEDHAPLEVDAHSRRPAQRNDHAARRQRHQHRGDPAPHLGCPQSLRHHPRQERRHGHGQQRDQPHHPPLAPPGQIGGRNWHRGGGLGKQKTDWWEIHETLTLFRLSMQV